MLAILAFAASYDWLGNLITGDEKNKSRFSILTAHKNQWIKLGLTAILSSKVGLHSPKRTLCILLGIKYVVYWKFLSKNITVTAIKY